LIVTVIETKRLKRIESEKESKNNL